MRLKIFGISILDRKDQRPGIILFVQCIIWTVVLVFPALCYSQQLRFDHIGTQEGLSQVNVTCIFQEDRGFIWVGTDDGLNRYDGYKFITYRPDPNDINSLSSNVVSDIVQDKNGNLWVATRNGLNKLDIKTGKFTRYLHDDANPNSISNNKINKLVLDNVGCLWIGTESGGLDQLYINKDLFKHYKHSEAEKTSISSNSVSSIYMDSKDRLWAAALNGLNLFDRETGSFIRFLNKEAGTGKPVGINIRCIYENNEHRLWIGTQNDGVYLFDPKDGSFSPVASDSNFRGNNSPSILSLCEDAKGNLWVGMENGGLSILVKKTGKVQKYVQDEVDRYSIHGNSIYTICKDRLGNIWLGAYNAGISLFKRNTGSFIHYRRNSTVESISNNFVWNIFEDSQKNIWVATDGGGVDRIDANTGKFTNYNNKNGLSGNYVLTITESRDGDVWMGTWGNAITILSPAKNKFTYLNHQPGNPNSLSSPNVYAIAETRDKRMWIGTIDQGLDCYDKKSKIFSHFKQDVNNPQSLSGNSILSLLADRAGDLWVGTNGTGLNHLDTKTGYFTRYTKAKNGLSDNTVPDIFEDETGNIWISTFDGLDKFDPKTKSFTVFTTEDGLPGNRIYGVREDDNKKIWVSTNKGLSVYDPLTGRFKNYTTEDGLQDDEFKPHSALKASDGKLYFGGINGFNVFFPSEILEPMGFSPMMITSFQIFNKPIANAAELGGTSSATQDISYISQLSLSYKQTFFTIEYAALDFSSPDKKKYAYMLEGFDKDWNYIGSRNNASYTNVPVGEYIFKVKYQNSAGMWSPEHSMLQIIIKPPFWLTWWFKTLVALIIIGCVFTYIGIRIRSIKRQKKKLEIQVHKKTAEVVAQKEALEEQQLEINQKNESLQDLVREKEWLLKEIHHRVKNNFHIVASLLEIQSSYLKNKDALSAIKESQNRIHSMSIIHQKLYQSDNLSTVNMPEYIYELVEYLRESYGIRENIRFELSIEKIELNHASAITLGLILNEAITNSIKYAFAKIEEGKISISLTRFSQSQMVLSISDNGRGLPGDFDSRIGASMGMELLQGLTDDLGGQFNIETNGGTIINVVFDDKHSPVSEVSFS